MQGPHALRPLDSRGPSAFRGGSVGLGGGSSDEGDADGDGGGLAPLRRLVGDEVLHHRVFGHVLHKVGLLHKEKQEKRLESFFPWPQSTSNGWTRFNQLLRKKKRKCHGGVDAGASAKQT